MSTAYTLTYSVGEPFNGWPSFYSYIPEYIQGMNSYLYTFSGGNVFRHNTNNLRNTYYGQYTASTITSALNPTPTEDIKLFKTLSYESNTTVADTSQARWAALELFTDLTDGSPSSMLETYFIEKEGEWFSFLRTNDGTVNWAQRSANGIGVGTVAGGQPAAATQITFDVPVGSIISQGDSVYAATVAGGVTTTAPILAGVVTLVVNTPGAYSITIDTTGVGTTVPTTGQFIMYIKDAVAESHGARGYYLQFKLSNDSTDPVEIYSVGSSVMKSYP
ncbi:MAG: putative structural protein [Prokaryotic dsDNA virus sp.]|nr:MAG: putative structural protein [Prokaryotic dsDNA virus sp.]|tara:strand:+ start:8911 stop:9738 length:828 start_codon:yes stop_codon:yes gene_type:complete